MTNLCPTPGVWLFLAGDSIHLTRHPRSDTSPLSYCPTCLGFGTVRSESA